MKRGRLLLLPAITFLLSGCGSSPPVATAPEPPKAPPSEILKPPEPAKPPPEPPRLMGLQALSEPPRPATVPQSPPSAPNSRPAQPAQPAQPTPTAQPATGVTSGEFAPGYVGGRSIQYWIDLLSTNNKEKVIEAINALGMARDLGKPAVPKLKDLAKSPDKDIASEAQAALKTLHAE